MVARWISLVVVALFFGQTADACILCSGLGGPQTTLRQSARSSKFVVIGTLSNPRLNGQTGATDFNIDTVVQNDPLLGGAKMLTVPTFIPVNPKIPSRYILFGDVVNGNLEVIDSRSLSASAVALADYLKGSLQIADKDRLAVLQYCYKHLDNANAEVATDAFHEFARANDQEIAQLAGKLNADTFRKLLIDPKTPSDRLSIFAYLLGSCGAKEDARLLVSLIGKDDERNRVALSGVLGGLIELNPEQGWATVHALLRDPKRPFADKLSAVRTLRFCQTCKPKLYHKEIMQGMAAVVELGDMADMAVEDLRRWHEWELTQQILAQYAKPTHSAPLVRGAIVRYALSCPNPEAVNFVSQLRRTQPDIVKRQEESLEFEKPVPASTKY